MKNQFPMLVTHPSIAYLDSAATALTPQTVIDAITTYYTKHNTNVSRGVDKLVYETTELYENVRTKVQAFMNADKNSEIIFTRGATTALNMVAFGFAQQILKKDDEIILNISEHHANIIPWQEVAKKTGAKLVYVDLLENGAIDSEHLATLLTEKTKIVSFAHVTNVLGSFNNPAVLIPIIRKYSSAYVVIDGAQGIVQYEVDVQAMDCDFYAFSGHKLFGPTGVGVLYAKAELLAQMEPFEFGGDMNHSVAKYNSEYKEAPHKFEAGTMMISEVLGLGAAIDFMIEIGYEAKSEYIKELRSYAIQELRKQENIILYNEKNEDSTTISFNLMDVHAHDAATVFSNESVVIRAGHHCAQLLLEKLQATSSLRASISIYNTKDDIDRLIEVSKKAGNFLDVLFG